MVRRNCDNHSISKLRLVSVARALCVRLLCLTLVVGISSPWQRLPEIETPGGKGPLQEERVISVGGSYSARPSSSAPGISGLAIPPAAAVRATVWPRRAPLRGWLRSDLAAPLRC